MVQVIGRSVFGRTVTQGTPNQVVSSWRPPESVITSPASLINPSISRYGSGSSRRTPSPAPTVRRSVRMRACVRGCTGNSTGPSAASCPRAPSNSHSVAASSTLAGRCSVAMVYSPRATPCARGAASARAAGIVAMRESIITLPTKWMRSADSPSRQRFSAASREGANSRLAT